jgi:hypothetical protein
MDNIAAAHYLNILKCINRSRSYKFIDIEKDIHKYTKGGNELTFEDIVKADYSKLKEIIKKYGSCTYALLEFRKIYRSFRRRYGMDLSKSLDITVCPYCNRNYINASVDFDHFFPISEYSLFSLSIYNLIPVCSACNRIKNNKTLLISPYDELKTTDNLLTFSPTLESINITYPTPKAIDPDMQTNIDIFNLKDSYKIHADIVAEIQFKAQKYCRTYVKGLSQITGFTPIINMTPQEFYYNNYLSEENYYKRPLSKMTKDVVEYFEKVTLRS